MKNKHFLNWIFSVKNTLSNQKKLLSGEPIQNFKIKIID